MMTKTDIRKISFNIAVISGIITLLVSILMLLNYWQISQNDPLESQALKELVQRSFSNPTDEVLKQDVRNLDLMARKAFFTSKWQIKMGTALLLASSILFIISLRVYFSQSKEIPLPIKKKQDVVAINNKTQKWIIGVGALVFILAIISGFLTQNRISEYGENDNISSISKDKNEDLNSQPEQIQIYIDSSSTQISDSSEVDSTLINVSNIVDSASVKSKSTKSLFATNQEIENNFVGFRGPWGNGVSHLKNIPTEWDKTSGKNILWKTEIPKHGYNSPIIWGEKIFLAGGDKTSRVVYCLDRMSGKILWQKEVKNVPGSNGKLPNTTDDTGLSAASLTTDGQRVFAIFANGDLIAFDMDGNQIWAKSFGIPDNHYGHSSSLITYRGKLFIQFDSNRGGKLIALNTFTGEEIWQITRKCKISWASPIIAEIDGQKQLILASNPIVAGYSLSDGKELWAVDCLYGEVGPSCGYGEGLIFAANEYAKLVAIDPADGFKIKWEDDEYLPEVSSPVVSKGLLFIATSYGVLVCYDAKSGEKYWEKEYSSGFYSSLIIIDGKLYAIDMGGITHIIAVSKEFKLIAEPKLNEKIVTTPAFSKGRIYIRGEKFLYCIGK